MIILFISYKPILYNLILIIAFVKVILNDFWVKFDFFHIFLQKNSFYFNSVEDFIVFSAIFSGELIKNKVQT